MPGLTPSSPVDATTALRGLVNTLAQSFEGQKTFRLATAANGERALTVGTSVADASVNEGFSLLSARTGIGGADTEWLKVRRPTSFANGVVEVNGNNQANTYQMKLVNGGAGVCGLQIANFGGGYLQVASQQSGSPVLLYAENKGLLLRQNANSHDTTTLMKFIVDGPQSVASSIPAFDFATSAALAVGQKLARWQINGTDHTFLDGAGFLRIVNGAQGLQIGSANGGITHNGTGFTFNTRATNNEYWQGTLFYHTGSGVALEAQTCARLSSDAVDGATAVAAASEHSGAAWSNATAKLHSFRNGVGSATEVSAIMQNGEFEHAVAGAGIVLKSPNGTRWRLTISNLGAAVIALA